MNASSGMPASAGGTGRLQRLSELGTGAMGVVHEAFDRDQQCRVAVKTLRHLDAQRLRALKGEFRRLRDAHHRNLVRLGELIEDAGTWCFTMELVRGVPFLEHLRGRRYGDVRQGAAAAPDTVAVPSPPTLTHTRPSGDFTSGSGAPSRKPTSGVPAPPGRIMPAFAQLGEAVMALHELGIVHRDLKSSNVLVTDEGRVVVLDFGVALLVGDRSHDLVGTPSYMAPEQLAAGGIGPEADWYAVGTMLYTALTGQLPFGRDIESTMARKRLGEWPDPRMVAPGAPAALAELCSGLLHPDPARRAGAEEFARVFGTGIAAPTPSSRSSFVGRETELAALDAAFDEVRAGAAAAVVLQGASGLGKSAAASEFLRRQRGAEPEPVVLRGRCHERESVPYKAFDAVIDQLAGTLYELPEAERPMPAAGDASALAALFPVVGEVLPATESANARRDASERRDLAFDALASLLRQVGARRPLIVAIDDIHWADADSLVLLEELTGARPAIPWLLVLTARPNEDGSPVPGLARVRSATRVLEMTPLSEVEARALAGRIAAGAPDAAIDVDAVIAESGGHPMFIEALVSSAAQPVSSSASVISLDQALRCRAEALGRDERGLFELVVTAGAPIPVRALRASSPLPPEAVADGLSRLVADRLVRAADTVEPYHDRIREALYASLGPERRRLLHGRLADGLSAVDDVTPDVLVPHFLGAGRTTEAARHALEAAEHAFSTFAFERSADHFAVALEHGGPDLSRRHVVARLADALARAGRPHEAGRRFVEAAELTVEDADARRELLRRAAEQFLQGGYLEEGLAVARAVVQGVGSSLPRNRFSAVLQYLWQRWRLERRPLAWESRAESEVPVRDRVRIDTDWAVQSGLSMVDSALCLPLNLRTTRDCLAAGEPARIARAAATAAIGMAVMSRRDTFDRLIEASVRAADEHGGAAGHIYVEMARAMGAGWMDDEWARGLGHLERAAELWRRSGAGQSWELEAIEFQRFMARAYLGDQRAMDEVSAAIRRARRRGNRFVETSLRCSFFNRWLLLDQPDAGDEDVREAHAEWLPGHRGFDNIDYVALRSRTEFALYRRPLDPAHLAELAREWKRFGRSPLRLLDVIGVDGGSTRAQVELRLAEMSDGRARRRHLRRAARHVDALGRFAHRAGRTYRDFLVGWLETLRGDHEAASAAYADAIAGGELGGRVQLLVAARACVALLSGGFASHPDVEAALSYWRDQGAARPERMLAHTVPADLASVFDPA